MITWIMVLIFGCDTIVCYSVVLMIEVMYMLCGFGSDKIGTFGMFFVHSPLVGLRYQMS